ncbi:MAG: InlB B-repeat-containing protein, partial [Prevotella sp.]|nr:InlB B-repeat-containing protein [Prevotella sp.]
YIESSATALFTAAYLKAIRLGYLAENDYKTVAVNGYKCLVNNFFSVDENGKVNIFGSCRSAGLGGSGDNYKAGKEKFRDGSKPYYLLGCDVARVDKSEKITEGKVLGAFIMAATEYERLYQPSTLLSKDLNSTYTLSSNESLSVEVLGDGTPTYQWYDANTENPIEGATDASYTPTKSGKYYCVIKVTAPSTSAKTRTASGSYTITTRTADVTVSGTSTGDTGNTGGESSTTGTAVTEVVTFQNQTPTVTYSMTPADATKIEVTAAGIDNSNKYLLPEYTAFVKMNSVGSLSLNIPDGATNINVTLLSSKSVDNLKLNSDSRTSTTWTGNDTDGYTYSFDIANSLAGTTYTIKKGDGISYIHKITITYSLGSSTEPAPSTDASARFTYNGLALSFTENVATITLESSQANSSITVNAAPATGASITTSSASTSIADNVITITAPAAGSSASYIYTVKAADGTKTQVYTINVIVKPYTVTFDAGTNGTCTTQSITQTSAGASITLPEVTPNTGYTFAGWYTAATDGDIIGDAGAKYNPTADITLYAHYTATSSGGGATSFSGVVYFTGTETNTSNENVVSVASGNMISNPGTITYKNVGYSNALKIESSTSVTLTLTAKSKVVLVFNPSNKGNTIKVDGTVHTIGDDGTITVSELGSGTHTITRGNGESYFYAVDIQSTGASLTITTQPASADYLQDATAAALTVAASIVNGTTSEYNFSYQWYSNDKESTTGSTVIAEGSGGKTASCTPDVTDIGIKYYYCVVTAKKGSVELTATSDFAKVTVNGPTVTFTTQPQGAVYKVSDSNVAALTVAATTNFKGDVTYQWYSNDTGKIPNPVDDKEKITNEVSANYTPSINTVGKTYYYCIASSKYNSKDYTAISDLVCVEVVTALYSYNVQGKTKPECNESRSIVDDSGKTLVKFTFGGWKYNNNKYLKPNAVDIDANYITDGWSDPATQAKVNALDGYEYAISGKNDAVQENKAEETTKYKKTRYGWFQSPTRDENGVTTDSHPYTLPVRGAYMTFEPTQNGTLTIYLLQNGAWNSDKKNNIDIIPGEFRMHAFQITNQRGLVLAEFAPQYKITVNQKVMDGYTCSQCSKDPGVGNYDKTSKDISNWEEFWTLEEAERQAVYDNWKNGNNGSQTIIKLKDGSFLAIQKAIVKYEFHVTGNETYYVFSNFSKLGFSGATFQPDAAQPTDEATFSGAKSLSDTKAYTPIKMESDGTTIGETGLTNYKYTINGKEVGKVEGVFIPQFKKITLNRTFKPNQWTTLSLPFNLTQTEVEQIFGKGTQIIVFDKAETTPARTYLTFFYHEIQNVLPGYPYLIRPTLVGADGKQMVTKSNSADYAPTYTINTEGKLTEFTVYNKAINPAIKQHEFVYGDYTAKCTPSYCTANVSGNSSNNYSIKYGEGDIFVSEGNGTVYISEGRSYGKGYRSYIEKDKTGTTTSAKALSISFSGVEDGDDNGTTTEIRVTELADDVIETLGIGGVYNLNGQKVADTTRNLPAGIYIVNGRKVVVK